MKVQCLRFLAFFSILCSLIANSHEALPFPSIANTNPTKYKNLFNHPACTDLFNYLGFGKEDNDIKNSDTFLILKNGISILEATHSPYTLNTPHRLWSTSKMVSNLIVGTAVLEGKLNLDDNLDDYYPADSYRTEFQDSEQISAYKKIKIRDLLFMQSGFEWGEIETQNILKLDIVKLTFSPEIKDVIRFVLSHKLKPEFVGKVFNYSTGDFVLLMGVLKKVYGKNYYRMPWKNLFTPLGIKDAVIEQDGSGVLMSGSNIYLSTFDLAKIGNLLLNDGIANGQRILPRGWVKMMSSPSPGQTHTLFTVERLKKIGLMGAPFFLNKDYKGVSKEYPNWPEDTFMSIGFLGQNLVMIPSKQIVFVRTGDDISYGKKVNLLGEKLFNCLEMKSAQKVTR